MSIELVSGFYSDKNYTLADTHTTVYRSFSKTLSKGTYTLSASESVMMLKRIINGEFTSENVLLPYTFTLETDGVVGFSIRTEPSGTWNDSISLGISKVPVTIADKLTTIAENEQRVFNAGKSKKWQEFMTSYIDSQQYHGLAFFGGSGWNSKTFYPTKDFRAPQQCFYYHCWWSEKYDMAARLEECGVRITTVNPNQTFLQCHVTRLPELKLESGDLNQTFNSCTNLVTIDKLKLGSNITSTDRAFYNCSSLKNIVIEGEMPVSISFSSSPLTVDSMKSIITALKDYSGTTNEFKYTLTLSSSCKTALNNEGNTSPNGNTWLDYANDKKWNIG